MSDLSARRSQHRRDRTIACFCEECERVLYVTRDEPFCPVCSSTVAPVVENEVDLTAEVLFKP